MTLSGSGGSGNYTNYFGGSVVKPSQVQYQKLTLPPDVTLVWPTESIEGASYVAAWIDVDAQSSGHVVTMPDATQGSTGVAATVNGIGSQNFTVVSNTGVLIASIAPGQAWLLILTDNTTQSGTWEVVQLGATSSTAQAAALAGAGLEAVLTQLQVAIRTVYLNTNTSITSGYRAEGIVWNGATGTLQLDTITNLTNTWWCLVTNRGTGAVTISTSGSDTINGAASISIPANPGGLPYATIVVASASGFNTFAGAPTLIPISGGGTGADNAPQALTNLGGSAIGIDIFEAPSAASILTLLGILPTAFTEVSIAINQNLSTSSVSSAFVCTAALQLNLPVTTTLQKTFVFAVFAQGGAVTLSPGAGDAINGQPANAAYIIPQNSSAIVTTDANGNWWLFALYRNAWVAAGGAADAITASFAPPIPQLLDGLIVGIRATAANATTTPTFAPDTFTAYTITKLGGAALRASDIAGANYECLLRYNLANTQWELLNPATPWLDVFGSTQGMILYRGASGWAALAVGTAGQYLSTQGAGANPQWVTDVPQILQRRTFTGSGSFTFPANTISTTQFRIYGVGGGGGGGSSAGGGNGNGSGGGGSGGYGDILVSGFAAAQVAAITIGAQGAGVAGNNAGTSGGQTIFNYNSTNVMVLTGGVGGSGAVGGTVFNAGGATGSVTLNTTGLTLVDSITAGAAAGAPGGYTGNSIAFGGSGGSNPLGNGGCEMPSFGLQNGQNASGFGAGGGGGANNAGPGATGGSGSPGILIIEWVA